MPVELGWLGILSCFISDHQCWRSHVQVNGQGAHLSSRQVEGIVCFWNFVKLSFLTFHKPSSNSRTYRLDKVPLSSVWRVVNCKEILLFRLAFVYLLHHWYKIFYMNCGDLVASFSEICQSGWFLKPGTLESCTENCFSFSISIGDTSCNYVYLDVLLFELKYNVLNFFDSLIFLRRNSFFKVFLWVWHISIFFRHLNHFGFFV